MGKAEHVQELINMTLRHVSANPCLTSSEWLVSDFEDCIWNVALDSDSVLNFRVKLEDNSFLTDQKNRPLLLFFKRLLLAQSNPHFTRGMTYANSSMIGRLDPAIHICEYMILRADEIKLGRFGLSAVPSSFSHRLLREVSTSESADSIYQFRARLKNLLKVVAADLPEKVLKHAVAEEPSIARSGRCDDLDLSEADIQKARAWLWTNNFYQRGTYEGSITYLVNTSRLSELLYAGGTLRSTWRKPVIDSLVLRHGPMLRREVEGVPVRGVERVETSVRYYLRALRAAAWMGRSDQSVPHGITAVVADKQFVQQLPLSAAGRYTTVPCAVVLQALRDALEFSLDRGTLLLKAYLTVVEHAMTTGSGMHIATRDLVSRGHPDLAGAGVEYWSGTLAQRIKRKHALEKSIEQIEEAFFLELRRGVGLYEQLQVLWGSLLICTGAVMAIRQGELLDLKAGDLFDKSLTRLKFRARKRNVANLRETILRPVPKIIVQLMKDLEGLQRDLIRLGALDQYVGILSFPRMSSPGLVKCNDHSCNMMLDRFCDFFEIEKDGNGSRYYVRQHQLRRFFAMLFFWGNSFSGLETLRWFLGHSDVRHLYHYITESTPGDVLRNVKVDFAIERLRDADSSADSLARVINARFNTTSIQLLDNAELAGLIGELLEDGKVTIEPHFFEGHSGQEYVILIKTEQKCAT